VKLTEALLLALDTETTGPNPRDDRIVELGGAYLVGGKPHGAPLKTRVNPGVYIPAGATNVHGVRNEDVEDAPPWPEVAPMLWPHVHDPRAVVVGYNIISFDVVVIDCENERHGIDWRMPTCLDPFIFASWYHRGLRTRRLAALMESTYELVLPEKRAHRADADALAVGLLAMAMIDEGIVPDDYTEAFAMQAELQRRLAAEHERFGRFLYEDRETGAVHVGLGKHTGTPLEEADCDYLKWLLGRPDVPEEARQLLLKQTGQSEQIGLF